MLTIIIIIIIIIIICFYFNEKVFNLKLWGRTAS